jgi:hypothetical protein
MKIPNEGIFDNFDRSILNDYSNRLLDQFLTAFPQESIYSIDNSENYYKPDGDRFVGAWVIEWLCPSGGYDWNIRLRSTEKQLTITWGEFHVHFGNWGRFEFDGEANECLITLNDIFTEKLWHITIFDDTGIAFGKWCEPKKIKSLALEKKATKYEIKSWLGTFDNTVLSEQEG